ncbi:pentapeptide repeat-containing protein [Desulfovibrio sp. JC022]|uniref:pentapeptide repeat-containing protein n=1 Tax=Desulfovibrio sp. JC022 TaxID=2593642 RepID=UPI0013D18FB7|nr:pentapeptide repeat-containing protein [Desulfovibrio sp. JC022]NDV23628.1 hypothetical protein [Desulfovibrio sp. JC022]
MGCCIGEKHSHWCEEYDIVYIDADGKKYCIFHAPAECKFNVPKGEPYDERAGDEKPALMDAEKFNKLIFVLIQEVNNDVVNEEQDSLDPFDWSARCNLSGTNFPYDITFSKYNEYCKYFPSINFNNSRFIGYVAFQNLQFKGYASFQQSQFYGDVSFGNSQFYGDVDFEKSQFGKGVSFTNSQFNRFVDFEDTQFIGDVKFEKSQFIGDTSFQKSQFDKHADFQNSQFNGYANFQKTLFNRYAHFHKIRFEGYASFQQSLFKKNLVFSDSTCNNINFSNAESRKQININNSTFVNSTFDKITFKGPVSFHDSSFEESTTFIKTIFHDFSNFEQIKFKGGAKFNSTFFKEWSYFRNVEFTKRSSFAGTISKETILMESVDLSKLKFAETNIESFKFIDCNWGQDRFAPILDEHEQTNSKSKATTLAEIYRRLKRIAHESSDEEQTSHWHYREKEMTRRNLTCISLFQFWFTLIIAILMMLLSGWLLQTMHPPYYAILPAIIFLTLPISLAKEEFTDKQHISKLGSKIYLNIYRFISGYGEEPIRAFMILLGIVALPFLLNFLVSLETSPPVDWLKHAMWYMPLIKIKFTNTDLTGLQYFFKGLSVSAITLQAALFGFALRNKLRR